jgi:hypothetical protein
MKFPHIQKNSNVLNIISKLFWELNNIKFVNIALKYILHFLESFCVNAVPLCLKCDVCCLSEHYSVFTEKPVITIQS